jgi:hypothetical protein
MARFEHAVRREATRRGGPKVISAHIMGSPVRYLISPITRCRV